MRVHPRVHVARACTPIAMADALITMAERTACEQRSASLRSASVSVLSAASPGDPAARNAAHQNTPASRAGPACSEPHGGCEAIARSIARRLPASVQLDDLIQAGSIGLIDAARRFGANRNLPFRLYARIRITGAIFDSLRELDWASRYFRTRQQKLDNATRALESKLGRKPDSEEVADSLGMDLNTFYEFAQAVQDRQEVEFEAAGGQRIPLRAGERGRRPRKASRRHLPSERVPRRASQVHRPASARGSKHRASLLLQGLDHGSGSPAPSAKPSLASPRFTAKPWSTFAPASAIAPANS